MFRLQAIGAQPLGFELLGRGRPTGGGTHVPNYRQPRLSLELMLGLKAQNWEVKKSYFLAVTNSEIFAYSRRDTTPCLSSSSALAYGRLAMMRSAVAGVIPGRLSSCALEA